MAERTLSQWLAFHESLHPATIDLTLERVTQVAHAMGVAPPAYPVITVAGTNGKGSTVSFCSALLTAAGVCTGQFTSPHFLRYSERIQVDGQEAGDAELIHAFAAIEAARAAISLTFFEFNTLAALAVFQARGVRAAVLEVGLGGRLDATNLVDADVGVLCSVGMDHSDYLGDTLDLIGAEKAGIFRAGRRAVLGTAGMPGSVFAALARLNVQPAVAGSACTWEVAGDGTWRYDSPELSLTGLPAPALRGAIQYRNAATALTAVQGLLKHPALAGVRLTQESVARALTTVRLAGRFQQHSRAGVEWLLDIAHNEPAARVLAAQVAQLPPPVRPDGKPGRTLAVAGVLKDKDAPAITQLMAPHVDHWFLCGLPGERGATAEALQARTGLAGGQVTLAADVQEGCVAAAAAAAPGDRVLVFGSVYTVGPALAWLGVY